MKRLDHDNAPTLNDFGVLVQVKKKHQATVSKRDKEKEILWKNRNILVDQNSCFIKVCWMPELLK